MAQAGHGAVHYPSARESWAGGLELFAAIMLIIIGVFHVVIGIAGLASNSYNVVTEKYIFSFDATGWGWLQLILGILVGLTGLALIAKQTWARVVAIIFVALSALTNFSFIPYQPMWSLLIIAIDVAVIWALAVHMRERPAEGATSQ